MQNEENEITSTLGMIFRKIEKDLQSIDNRLASIDSTTAELKSLIESTHDISTRCENSYKIILPESSPLLTTLGGTLTTSVTLEDPQMELKFNDD